MTDDKLDRFIRKLPIEAQSEVLDIACGKGEMLIKLTENYDIRGIGVDLSPYAIAEAQSRTLERVPNANITYVEKEGKAYVNENNSKNYNLTICLGASWIFDGHKNTLQNLQKVTKHNGLIIVGEPFWEKIPSEWYLESTGIKFDDFGTHIGNIRNGEEVGLRPIFSLTSSNDDWEWYEHQQWLGIDHHLQNNPDDPDNDELIEKFTKSRDEYLREGRKVFGWAIYVFRNVEDKEYRSELNI